MATFYYQFNRSVSTIIAHIKDCPTKGDFIQTQEVDASFKIIEEKLQEVHVPALPDFDKLFQVDCDASSIRVRASLSQEDRPIAYFREN